MHVLGHLRLRATLLQFLLFPFKVAIQAIRPLANSAYVQPHVVLLLRGRTDGERMPLVVGNRRDIDKHIVARTEMEMIRPLDDQMHHLGGQQQSGTDIGLPMVAPHPDIAQCSFHDVDQSGEQEPLPEVGSMEEAQYPKGHVEQMGPIEDLKAALPPDKGLGAHKHNNQNRQQSNSRGISTSWNQAKESRTIGEQPLADGVVSGVYVRIVDHNYREVEQVHHRVDQAQHGYRNARQLVEVNVVVQWQVSGQTTSPQVGQGVPQHQHQNPGAVEVKALS